MQSESIANLAKAIAKAQSELKPVKKDTINPFFGKKYAELSSVWEALKPYHDNGIAITQAPYQVEKTGYIGIETQLTHISGEWIKGRLELPIARSDAQGFGSAITYARRYALGCMTGVVTEDDDDGNVASGKHDQPAVQTARTVNQQKMKTLKKVEQDGVSDQAREVNPQQAHDAAPPLITDEQWDLFLDYMGDDPERTNIGKQLKALLGIGKVADLTGDLRKSFILQFQDSCRDTGVPCSQWVKE